MKENRKSRFRLAKQTKPEEKLYLEEILRYVEILSYNAPRKYTLVFMRYKGIITRSRMPELGTYGSMRGSAREGWVYSTI